MILYSSKRRNIIIIIISYADVPAGVPVLLLLNTKETVPYRPDKNPCQLLKATIRIHPVTKERRPFAGLRTL
jgi:hypothetical protein